MEAADPALHRSLSFVLEHDVEESGLDLVFAADFEYFGRRETRELVPGGRELPVTEANKARYVALVADRAVYGAARAQTDALARGVREIVPPALLGLFDEGELALLARGVPAVDVDDLERSCGYGGGLTAASDTARWLWAAVRSWPGEDVARLVQFVTGSARAPPGGFAGLRPGPFRVHRDPAGPHRLPQAHTCSNQLDLPDYPDRATLERRLLTALREGGEGFGFA